MISLNPNEKVVLVIRRHWYALARHIMLIPALLFLPVLFFALAGTYSDFLLQPEVRSIVNFAFSLYLLGILLYAFTVWTNYYLDVWIITDKRLIDIEQKTLFTRIISELPMSRVQNITIEIPGFLATMLGFGNIKVETASQSTFIIRDAPDMYKAKKIILKYVHQQPPVESLNPKP